jgi:hypothetical protein
VEGTLIGDANQFFDFVKEKYQKNVQISKETQKRRTILNIKEINDYMRRVRFKD